MDTRIIALKALREIARWTTHGGEKPENSTTMVVNRIARTAIDEIEEESLRENDRIERTMGRHTP